MRRAIGFMVRLYPIDWRHRYKAEFEALLDDSSLGWRDLFDVFKGALAMQFNRWQVMVAGCGLAGAMLGAALSFAMPPRYVSTAAMRVQAGAPDSDEDAVRVFYGTMQKVLSRASLTDVINNQGLYQSELGSTAMDDVIHQMRKDIRIGRVPSPHANGIHLSFAYDDRIKAQQTAGALVHRLMAALHDQPLGQRKAVMMPTLEMIDPPNLPRARVNSNLIKGAWFGLAAGLLAGSIVARARRQAPHGIA